MKRLATIVALGLLVTACGSSDGGETTTDAPTTTVADPVATTGATTSTAAPASTTAAPATTTTTTKAPDVRPPELIVTAPAEGATVADSSVEFHGTVEAGVQGVWSPPGHEATVDTDGNWEVTIDLQSGHNTVVFFALDQAANETTVERHVTYTAPMPCDGMDVVAEHVSAFPLGANDWCGGWGYIASVSATEIVFDLIQVNLTVPGDESQGWTFVNANPMLRYLPLSSAIEIRACPPAAGDTSPGSCGSPWVGPESWQFSLWSPADLTGFVAASDELWNVMVDPGTGEIVWVEQWWTP